MKNNKKEKEDSIAQGERFLKELHDNAGKYTQPVLRRYPLLFTFLVVFSVAAILHGFELVSEQVEIFEKHPSWLIFIGIGMLFLTGRLYKSLEKVK